MSTLYVSEYTTVCAVGGVAIAQAAQEPAPVEQALSISASPTQSAAFGSTTNFVRVHCDVVCSILFGSNPTAVTNAKRLAANQTEFFGVQPGQKLSVILNV